jgi:hypothetical protein
MGGSKTFTVGKKKRNHVNASCAVDKVLASPIALCDDGGGTSLGKGTSMSTVDYDVGLRLSPELAGTLMTPEEFDAVDDWDEDFSSPMRWSRAAKPQAKTNLSRINR